jgi:hypothetical protein
MPGTANLCDAGLLEPGSMCIIEVDDVNSPTGLWWGTVVEVIPHDNYLAVSAKITGGKFTMNGDSPVLCNEEQGQTPHVNYTVYPSTKTTRRLFSCIKREQANAERARMKSLQWKTTHLETMEHLVRRGLVSPE